MRCLFRSLLIFLLGCGVLTAETEEPEVYVPEGWKAKLDAKDGDYMHIREYTRSGAYSLYLSWETPWSDGKFAGGVKVGNQIVLVIGNIMNEDTLVALMPIPESNYSYVTLISDEGEVKIVLNRGDEMIDTIIVDGRNTRLIDDESYTRARCARLGLRYTDQLNIDKAAAKERAE